MTIKIKNKDISISEKKVLQETLRKINKKRKRDDKPRLQYKIKFK